MTPVDGHLDVCKNSGISTVVQHDFSIFFKKLESHNVQHSCKGPVAGANANNWIFKFFQEGLFTKAPISHQCGLGGSLL